MSNITVLQKPGEITFDKLDQVISSLGDSSRELTPEEKVSACTAIDSWEKLVIGKINEKVREMNDFVHILQYGPFGHVAKQFDLVEKFKAICQQTGLSGKYDALAAAITEANEFEYSEKPSKPFTDEGMSQIEIRRKKAEFDAQTAVFQLKLARLNRKVQLLWDDLQKSLRKNKEYKELLQSCQDWLSKTGTFQQRAREKADIAKMNVAISSLEVRQLLRQLFDYKIEI